MQLRHVMSGLLGLVCCVMFSVNFIRNVTRVGMSPVRDQFRPEVFESFQQDSESYVTATLEQIKQHGPLATHGLLYDPTARQPYLHRSGVQALVYGLPFWVFGDDVPGFVNLLEWVMAVLLALTLTAFVFWVAGELGRVAAVVVFCLLNCSTWMVMVARNPAWAYSLFLLPSVASFILTAKVDLGRLQWKYSMAVLGVLIFVRALFGYEYITNVILGATVAPIYYALSRGWGARVLVRLVATIIGIGVMAFVVALAVQTIQVSAYMVSFPDAVQNILGSALARTHGPSMLGPGHYEDAAPPSVPTLRLLSAYMSLHVVSLPWIGEEDRVMLKSYLTMGALVVGCLTCCLGVFAASCVDGCACSRTPMRRKLEALSVACLWGLGASLSWGILAKGHMFHHIHMNGMMFYVPFLVIFYAMIGFVVGELKNLPWVLSGRLSPEAPVRLTRDRDQNAVSAGGKNKAIRPRGAKNKAP